MSAFPPRDTTRASRKLVASKARAVFGVPSNALIANSSQSMFMSSPHSIVKVWTPATVRRSGSRQSDIDSDTVESYNRTCIEGVTLVVNFKRVPCTGEAESHGFDEPGKSNWHAAERWLDETHVWNELDGAMTHSMMAIDSTLRSSAAASGRLDMDQMRTAAVYTNTEQTQTIFGTMESLGVTHRDATTLVLPSSVQSVEEIKDTPCA